MFPTADRPLVLAVGNDKQFRALVRALGCEHLAESELVFRANRSRVTNRESTPPNYPNGLTERGSDEWFAIFTEIGVPAGPINDIGQAFDLAKRLDSASVDIEGAPHPRSRTRSRCRLHAAAVPPAPPRLSDESVPGPTD